MKSPSPNGSKGKRSGKDSASDWIKNIYPNKVIGDAQRILKTAVDVLEEEIAAGIVAAKKLEKKVINVDEVRSTNPEELMSRIRRDTHDAVDIFLDAVTALTNYFSNLTQTVSQVNGNAVVKETANNVQVVKNEGSAKPGSTVEIPILLTNNSKDQPMPVELNKADLTGPDQEKIRVRYITIEPQSFALEPEEKKEVIIKIRVPLTCKPGSYSGLFQDNKNQNLRTVITIDVA